MKCKKLLAVWLAFTIVFIIFPLQICAYEDWDYVNYTYNEWASLTYTYDEWNNYILGPQNGWYYEDDGYDVIRSKDAYVNTSEMFWYILYDKEADGYFLCLKDSDFDKLCKDRKIKIPDSYRNENEKKESSKVKIIKYIEGSCALKEFDLNPQNQHMELKDNVVFSKDGKILMSYARYDEREVYEVPNGTEIIGRYAFLDCDNIKQLKIPNTVREIQFDAVAFADSLETVNIPTLVENLDDTFWNCYNLEKVYIPKNSKLKKINGGTFNETNISELILPNFEIEISNLAFGKKEKAEKVKLKSYVKPDVSSKCIHNACYLTWNDITNASYYEVYQKKNDGSYKFLKTVERNSIKINGLKKDKEYIFAVKAVAKVTAQPYNPEDYMVHFSGLPEYYTIEGSMSDDVTFIGGSTV